VTSEETSPDVCYRHPKRESWVLCQRCGRTICPECQILAPVGVQCPECVREAGGSVTWRSAGGAPRPAAKPRRTRPARATPSSGGGFGGALGRMLRPGSEAPVFTWSIVGIVVVLWLAGLFTTLPALLLSLQVEPWQVWRFFTASLVYPAGFGWILSVLLNSVFFLLTAPAVEQRLGRTRFAVTALAAAGIGNAAMVLSGSAGFGLIGVLFGMFGAYLVFVWSYPPARAQALIITGINLLIAIAFGSLLLPAIVGGLLAGAGSAYLFQRADDNARSTPRTPYLIIGAVVLGLIAFALLRIYLI